MFHGQTGALWRVIQVKITNAREDDPSVFVFCTKKQPQRFLYLADSIVGCAKGLEDAKSPNEECLFHLIPPGDHPICIPLPHTERLSETFTVSESH